tara:strand:- start:325 stop:480 length:156 start_codon:yes stop_codon:yes gene_type:complete
MVTRPCLNENRGTDIVTAVDIVNQILQKIALFRRPVLAGMVIGVADRNLGL